MVTVKGSALYMVIILALVIGIICSALVVVAYIYQSVYQKAARYDRLESNLNSGRAILLADSTSTYQAEKGLDLFNDQQDSVLLHRYHWGIFDIGTVKSFMGTDTVKTTFEIGATIDTSRTFTLYVADEDRPLSVSGKTAISGNAYLPKSGVRAAYVNNKGYEGIKAIVAGHKYDSQTSLPPPEKNRLSGLQKMREAGITADSVLADRATMKIDFIKPVYVINFKKSVHHLSEVELSGRLLVLSDTTIIIDSSAHLQDVIILAKNIRVNEGFKGRCQLFVTDSLTIGAQSNLAYPSCLGIIPGKDKMVKSFLGIGEQVRVNGTVFTTLTPANNNKPVLEIGKMSILTGQVYAAGVCSFKNGLTVNGTLWATRFLYKNDFTLYENYLINAQINFQKRSPYFLSGMLLPATGKKNKIIRWLDQN